jgi:hypothetical protein
LDSSLGNCSHWHPRIARNDVGFKRTEQTEAVPFRVARPSEDWFESDSSCFLARLNPFQLRVYPGFQPRVYPSVLGQRRVQVDAETIRQSRGAGLSWSAIACRDRGCTIHRSARGSRVTISQPRCGPLCSEDSDRTWHVAVIQVLGGTLGGARPARSGITNGTPEAALQSDSIVDAARPESGQV